MLKSILASKRTSSRRAGRISTRAIVMAACAVLVLGAVSVWVARRHAPAPHQTRRLTPAAVPDISRIPAQAPGAPAALSGGREFFVQFVRPDDPNALAGEVKADRATPLEQHRVALERPRAWFFLEDGRSLHVSATRGRLTLAPRTSSPTDGLVEDDVRVWVFAPRADPRRPDPTVDLPVATLHTSRIEVDWANGRLDLPDDVRFDDDRVSLRASGVQVDFDPPTSRIDALRVARLTEPVRIRTRASDTQTSTPSSRQQHSPATITPSTSTDSASRTHENSSSHSAPASPPLDDPPEEAFYSLVASGDVVMRQGARVARSGVLHAWARTLGGALAISQPDLPEVGTNQGRESPKPDAAPLEAPKIPTPATAGPTASVTPSVEDDVVALEWTGPLLVRRELARPSQLARDDAFVTMTADARTPVTLEVQGAGLRATGQRLDLGATRQTATLSGADGAPALVIAEAQGRAESPVFEIDRPRALVTMPRGGSLVTFERARADSESLAGPPVPVVLSWQDEGEFRFDSLRGGARARLIGARTSGQVRASRAGAFAAGDTASVDFFEPARIDGNAPVRTVRLMGRVHAEDGAGGVVRADALAAHFARDEETSSPERIEAHGHAQASRDGESLAAPEFEVRLTNDQPGRESRAISTVRARGGFVFTGRDGLIASGDDLDAHAAVRKAILSGKPARVARGQSSLSGPRLEIDDSARSVHVHGPGTFHHVVGSASGAPTDPSRPTQFQASWTSAMMLDDAQGVLKLEGDAELIARAESGATSTARAPLVHAWFEPAADDPRTVAPRLDDAKASSERALPARRITRALLEGDDTSTFATLTHRERHEGTQRVARLLSLLGARIEADFSRRALDVVGGGRLLSSTRDHDPSTLPPSTMIGSRRDDPARLSGSGDALFAWKQSASLRLDEHLAELVGGVRMVHRRTGDDGVTELECERLDAAFLTGSSESNADALSLSRAEARGAVWARSSGRELSSQSASYDAVTGLLDARCDGCQVMLSDPGAGRPLNAGEVRWNLLTGRVDIIDASPVSGPR